MAEDQGPRGPLTLARYLATYLGLLTSAAVAVFVGFQDVFSPVSLSAQIIGLSFLLAGITGLGAVAILYVKTNMPFRKPVTGTENWQVALAAAGVMAGLYVDLVIAFYAAGYKPVRSGTFGALAFLDLLLAFQVISSISGRWKEIGRSLAGASLLAAFLAGIVQFWYQSVYLPESTQVAIEYSLSAGPVIQSGSNRLVTLTLTMKNVSSASATILNSMIIVTGLSYPSNTEPRVPSPAETQQNIVTYAQSLSLKNFSFSVSKLPDIGYTGSLTATTLAALRPTGNNSYLFPDDTYSRDFTIVIPESGIQVIDARVKVIYARTARLTLGGLYSSGMLHYSGCASSEQFTNNIVQSALRRFTDGNFVFITNWCADIKNPDISARIARTPEEVETAGTESALIAHYGVFGNTHIDTFALEPAGSARP
jgi:hypothetical protein